MKWLKKIFKSKDDEPEIPVEISIELHKIDSWINKRLDKSFSEISPEIKGRLSQLRSLESQLKSDLEDLESADLHNPNITERELQLMEGNRASYIQQHDIFLKQIHHPEDIGFKNTSEFCEQFEQLLLKLAKATGRSHMVISEFFHNNAKQVNKTIKKMSDTVSEMKEKMQDYDIDVEKNDRIFAAVHELQAKSHRLSEIEEDLAVFNQKLENSKKMREKLERNIEQLKQGDSYTEFKELDHDKQEHRKTITSITQDIDSLFSLINKPMRKFERIAFDNVDTLQAYIDNPTQALMKDPLLKILPLLRNLRTAVEEDKVGLKDKDKDKALDRIDSITKDVLVDAQAKYDDSKAAVKDISTKMKNIRALQELGDLDYKIDHVNNQIQLLEEKIDKNNKAKEKIDLDALQKEVEKLISSQFNISLTVLR